MITVGSITDWVGLPVLDRDGSKIGSMEAVYFDTSTDEPVFITVKVGLIGSSLVFVPLADAVVSPKDVRVTVDKKLAKDAPSIETDGQNRPWNPLCLRTTGLSTRKARRASAGWGAAKQLACQSRGKIGTGGAVCVGALAQRTRRPYAPSPCPSACEYRCPFR